ncbi:unnamed protein product [Trifolium pratense]|uniref:Uncharacterized protein n=1 Tax=Trifolium pratense TaxID=57577 RepID=A0ACB0MDZ7_TRIPR|nr:unnamed protein product [Trifolium pratense]
MHWFEKKKHINFEISEVLCELEFTIKRMNISTTPDGIVMDLFSIKCTWYFLVLKRNLWIQSFYNVHFAAAREGILISDAYSAPHQMNSTSGDTDED